MISLPHSSEMRIILDAQRYTCWNTFSAAVLDSVIKYDHRHLAHGLIAKQRTYVRVVVDCVEIVAVRCVQLHSYQENTLTLTQ